MTDKSEHLELREFCALCFADDKSGSWGHVTTAGFCTNCCANGSTVQIPAWAVRSIREQASWVGKRYYPHAEDRDAYEERKALLELVAEFPGRSAEEYEDRPGEWRVTQILPVGSVQTTRKAVTADQAMRECGLPYIHQSVLDKKGAKQ